MNFPSVDVRRIISFIESLEESLEISLVIEYTKESTFLSFLIIHTKSLSNESNKKRNKTSNFPPNNVRRDSRVLLIH